MNEKIKYNWRYVSIAVVFSLFGLAIIAQMVRIQLTVNSSELPIPSLLGQWEKAASRRGMILDRNGRITGFQEKPLSGEAKSDLANSGIYFFEPEVFNFMPPRGQFYDFGKNLFPELLEKDIPYYGYKHKQYWNDVGSLDEYQQGNFDALEGKVSVDIAGKKIKEGVWIGKNCNIQEDVTIIPPVCIGDDCTIKRGA